MSATRELDLKAAKVAAQYPCGASCGSNPDGAHIGDGDQIAFAVNSAEPDPRGGSYEQHVEIHPSGSGLDSILFSALHSLVTQTQIRRSRWLWRQLPTNCSLWTNRLPKRTNGNGQ